MNYFQKIFKTKGSTSSPTKKPVEVPVIEPVEMDSFKPEEKKKTTK